MYAISEEDGGQRRRAGQTRLLPRSPSFNAEAPSATLNFTKHSTLSAALNGPLICPQRRSILRRCGHFILSHSIDSRRRPLAVQGEMTTLDVVVPAGVGAGDTIEVTDPDGNLLRATVPDGLQEGDIFQLTCGASMDGESIMQQFEDWFEREKVDDQIEEWAIRNAQRLQITDAELAAGADGEQPHEWWPLYLEYQQEFEALLQRFLDEAGCTSEDFLTAVDGASASMASTYASWITSLSSYENFLELMTDEEAKQRRLVAREG